MPECFRPNIAKRIFKTCPEICLSSLSVVTLYHLTWKDVAGALSSIFSCGKSCHKIDYAARTACIYEHFAICGPSFWLIHLRNCWDMSRQRPSTRAEMWTVSVFHLCPSTSHSPFTHGTVQRTDFFMCYPFFITLRLSTIWVRIFVYLLCE